MLKGGSGTEMRLADRDCAAAGVLMGTTVIL